MHSQTSSQQVLSESEKRLILSQLIELEAKRSAVLAYEDFIKREQDQVALEKSNYSRALELEKQATALAQKERDIEKQRADLYEGLYKALTKKKTIGCILKKIFTLGIARCGG